MFIGVHQRQLWFNLSVHGPSVNYIYSNDKSFNSELTNWSNCVYISGRLFNVIYIITDQIHAAHTPKSNTFKIVLSCINSGIGCHTLLYPFRYFTWRLHNKLGRGVNGFPLFDLFFRCVISTFTPAHLKAKFMANIYSVQQDVCTNRLIQSGTIIPNLGPCPQYKVIQKQI